jgi:hypothetical protein
MKFTIQLTRFSKLSAVALCVTAWSIHTANLLAGEPNETAQKSCVAQSSFTTPEEAIKALQAATKAKETACLADIFGPAFYDLSTGDKVQDANNAKRFATAVAQGCHPVKDGEDRVFLEIGTNNWPMPIPLVKADGQWRFDTEAGKEEVINRHIGKDELHAIGVCRAYVTAQVHYASMEAGAGAKYAQKFKSAPGEKDGLYWPAVENEPASPFGPLVAEANAEGYVHAKSSGPHPFHGYYFRILTRQGSAAPGGKMNYMNHGKLTGGFALVAYPEHWDQSGIMTFIVNQDGKIYQRNLGQKTRHVAAALKEFNPDHDWTPVEDEGVMGAVADK